MLFFRWASVPSTFVWTSWVSGGRFTPDNLSWRAAPSVHTSVFLCCVAWMWWPSAVDAALCVWICYESDVTTSNRCLCSTSWPPPSLLILSSLCLLTVCGGSWLPEQVVQTLLPDRYLQGLRREVWSPSWPRRPGISSLNTLPPTLCQNEFLLSCKAWGEFFFSLWMSLNVARILGTNIKNN